MSLRVGTGLWILGRTRTAPAPPSSQHKYYLPIALVMAFVVPTLVCGLGWGDYYGE